MAKIKDYPIRTTDAITGAEFAVITDTLIEQTFRVNLTDYIASTGGGAGHVIQTEGVNLANRTNLDFVGAGVVVSDVGIDDKTLVTISSVGVPEGGTEGQVLAKIDANNYNTEWITSFGFIEGGAAATVYQVDDVIDGGYANG